MSELEVVTPNLRGSCVTVHNQIHGLFRLTSRKSKSLEMPAAWPLPSGDRSSIQADQVIDGRSACPFTR
jgi:hypothetical protein